MSGNEAHLDKIGRMGKIENLVDSEKPENVSAYPTPSMHLCTVSEKRKKPKG